jgi:uncharacterized membrane protein YphA (DoxX/SURF4 family)/thiol-disulfide isomerase/thioredoxin
VTGVALVGARLVLAAVFAFAGLAKLADRRGTRAAFTEFGLPAALVAPLALLVPAAEVVVAVALMSATAAWAAAIAAVALLAIFSAAIAVNLAWGRRPACHCLGRLGAAAIGPSTLVRNAALAAGAGFIVWRGRDDAGASMVAWTNALSIADLIALGLGTVALVLGAVILWLLGQLVGQNGRVLARLDALETRLLSGGTSHAHASHAQPAGLPVGTTAPAVALPDVHGKLVTLPALRAAGKPVLLAFMEPGCGPCAALLPDLLRWQRELTDTMTLAVIVGGDAGRPARRGVYRLARVLRQEGTEVMRAYGAPGAPSAVLVRPDGTVGSALASGGDEIRALVDRLTVERILRSARMPG